jgi:hypothetical protein
MMTNVGIRDNNGRVRRWHMSVQDTLQGMIDELTDSLADAAKHDRGNSAAGTRVRKTMQNVKNGAQAIRIQVQNDKNSR